MVVAALAACSNGDGGTASSGPAPSRGQAADQVKRDVIVPGYANLAAKADALVAAVSAACGPPIDETKRDAAQAAWREADSAWAATRAYRYGPTKVMRAITKIDYPVDAEKVEALLSGTETLDAATLAGLGADRRGLGAVELVLFGDAPLDERSCQLAAAATTLVADATHTLVADWNADATDADMAVEDGVNGMIFALSDVGDMQLAKAAGLASGTPAPADADQGPARAALAEMTSIVDGVDAVWSKGYRPLVEGVSRDTSKRVDEQLAAVQAALGKIPSPLADVRDAGPVKDAYEAVRSTLVTLRTEVASQLGVTLQLSDADGDS